MSKIKDCYYNIKDNWNEEKTAKTAKIISFFAGLFGNILGIILVAIWKYVFANNSEKSKYCVRIAFIGWLTNVVICFKFFMSDPFYFMNKKMEKMYKKAPISVEKVYIDDFFDREFEEMNKSFKRQRKMFDQFFDFATNEAKNIEQNNKNVKIEEKNNQSKTTKKVIKEDNGFETTIIEETSPIGYTKITTRQYVGNEKNKNNKVEENDKKVNKKEKVKNKKESKKSK